MLTETIRIGKREYKAICSTKNLGHPQQVGRLISLIREDGKLVWGVKQK